MEKDNQILVPIDFSDQSEIALQQAINFSKAINADLTLINVIDQGIIDQLAGMLGGDKDGKQELIEKNKSRLDKIADSKRSEGLKIATVVECGKIYEQIAKVSEKLGIDFIVIGTTGASALKKKFLGGNAVRIIRSSNVPVISIKGKSHRLGVQNIILPLDVSKETKDKVSRAVDLAKIFGSTIKVLNVQDTDDEFIVNKLERQLNQVAKYLSEQGVTCTTTTITGDDIAKEVLEFAKKEEGDLIMIMTQQETGFTEYFIGSSAQEIINSSEVPVLSIRPIPRKDFTEFVVQ